MTTSPDQILRPVVALDVDGTLGYYHEHFLTYAEEFLQRATPDQWDGSMPFWQCAGTSKLVYREMKLGYRQGRHKRSMPVVPHSAELTRALRKAGAEVWVCTTRPYLRLDNIDPDTRWWLRHHGIQYDGVLFGDSKYRDLRKLVGSARVVAVLDDDPDLIRQAESAGLPSFLIDREYNRTGKCERFTDLIHAEKFFVSRIEEWRKERGV